MPIDPASTQPIQVQAFRVDCGAVPSSTTREVTCRFPQNFPGTDYTVVASIAENISSGGAGATVRQVRTKAPDSCVIRVMTQGQAFAAGQLFLDVIAVYTFTSS